MSEDMLGASDNNKKEIREKCATVCEDGSPKVKGIHLAYTRRLLVRRLAALAHCESDYFFEHPVVRLVCLNLPQPMWYEDNEKMTLVQSLALIYDILDTCAVFSLTFVQAAAESSTEGTSILNITSMVFRPLANTITKTVSVLDAFYFVAASFLRFSQGKTMAIRTCEGWGSNSLILSLWLRSRCLWNVLLGLTGKSVPLMFSFLYVDR